MSIRAAWCDKKNHKYYFGDWREKKYLEETINWVNEQNKKNQLVFFWIEELVDNKVKNYIIDRSIGEYVDISNFIE